MLLQLDAQKTSAHSLYGKDTHTLIALEIAPRIAPWGKLDYMGVTPLGASLAVASVLPPRSGDTLIELTDVVSHGFTALVLRAEGPSHTSLG